MSRRRRTGGGSPLDRRRTITPGVGKPAAPRPRPALDAPGTLVNDPDPVHWHFWRLGHKLDAGDLAARQVPLDVFFVRDLFASVAEAAEALAEDVVTCFPHLKGKTSLAEAVRLWPANPGAQYAYPTKTTYTMWSVLGCGGDCEALFARVGGATQAHIAKTIKDVNEE